MNTQFITDANGKKIAVVLPIEKYKKMLEKMEDLEDIRLYKEGKAAQGEGLPIDEAFRLIEIKRKKLGLQSSPSKKGVSRAGKNQ